VPVSDLSVLVVDDDPSICQLFSELLRALGYQVATASSADAARRQLDERVFDALLLDLVMPGVGGLELLRELRAAQPMLPILIVTGYGSFDAAVEAMRLGASDLITKPIDAPMLDLRIRKARELELARRWVHSDSLTGLHNRRYFEQRLLQEVQRARRYQRELSLLLIDLDEFRSCNESWGHAYGDLVLIEVARLLTSACRRTDLVARYGGEEFVVGLTETGFAAAREAAERLRRQIGGGDFTTQSGHLRPLPTVSIGVACLEAEESVAELLGRAEAALAQAKSEGRDRVCPCFVRAAAIAN
jgi:two-component system cell cycle response regulator